MRSGGRRRRLHSLEGPDEVVQVGGDVAHGELQGADDIPEAEHNAHVFSRPCSRTFANSSQRQS